MKVDFKLSNLAFLPDGNSICSPVGNRVAIFDLVNNKSRTFPHQTRADIAVIAVSPNGKLLMAVDVDGYAVLINIPRNVLLHRINFKSRVRALKFSPDGQYFAVTHGKKLQVWRTPGLECQFNPFSLHRTYTGHSDDIISLDWSHDSRYVVTGSLDCTARVFTLQTLRGYRPCVLASHKSRIVQCAFFKDSYDIETVSHDGTLVIWKWQERELKIERAPLKKALSTRRSRAIVQAVRSMRQQQRLEEQEARKKAAGGAAFAPGQNGDGADGNAIKEEEEDEDEREAASGEEDNTSEGSSDDDGEEDVEGSESDGDADDEDGRDDGDDDDSDGGSDDDDDDDATDAGAKRSRAAERVEVIVSTLPFWSVPANGRHYFRQGSARVTCAVLHKGSSILTVGFSNGVFGLYDLPEFNNIHTLSVSQKRITAADINASGEWLALGCSRLGQLLVWEWQSESYVLKQQGHFYDMDVLTYSPEGHVIATGGADGKVKLWNTTSGFCFVTFKEHAGGITGLTFTPNGMAVLSSSLDGTVRAFDLMRYRNFRTFATPEPTQLSCVAVDPSGELVCAASQDSFEMYVWSMQTGKLVDALTGHTAPVSAVKFHTEQAVLLSTSWDGTLRIWDIFESKGQREALDHGSDVVCMAQRSDGKQLVTSTLKGFITFWDYHKMIELGSLDCRRDIRNGRRDTDLVSSKHMNQALCWTSLAYSPDGSCVLAGGRTKLVCLYSVEQQVLLAYFSVSENLSMDGIKSKLNSKFNTEFGPLALIDADSDSDVEERVGQSLPGVTSGDHSTRRTRPEIRTKSVAFSPSGHAWSAATTEGLITFSLDDGVQFDPYDLDVDVTPATVREILAEKDFPKALSMAFRLSEQALVQEVLETIPPSAVKVVVELLPVVHIEPLLRAIARLLPSTRHLAFYMTWVMHVFNVHGRRLREESATMQAVMRELQKAITEHHKTLGSLCDDNTHMLSFASHMLVAAQQRQEEGEMELEFGADERLTGGGDDDDDDDDEKGAVDA
ncbi:hypothetical protein PTSG_08053 [Salpingoeca rosetta]|uniref:Small-subunit processome Utp12 domain-containing protein n=1 Tax=Salpingoeca rosetta (strain ATCC 50818 / BSB-021) TaxID=946362 RepID=F2UHV3_SALR5|nr:uncharacterized protein PTSG_08053 [Salpingoeca rosetta]EGD76702.1 hypothetical protein PTSG_08053 [Salpingoeca rosetta]|eukprot:XP_004991074.1 hypothetical protein PTSG_08053 [Salpingoeca rosetta]